MLFSNQNKTKSQNYIIVVLGLLGMLEVCLSVNIFWGNRLL